jgi:single-strand DNA-binding protein
MVDGMRIHEYLQREMEVVILNKVILMGRLTGDPELKVTTGGKSVCTFNIAVNRIKKEETDFFKCQAWDAKAEFINKYFRKGNMIAITGRLQNRSWDGKDGKKQYITEVIVEESHFTGEKKGEVTTKPINEFVPQDDEEKMPWEV